MLIRSGCRTMWTRPITERAFLLFLENRLAEEILEKETFVQFRENLAVLREQGGEVSFPVRMSMEKGEIQRWYQVTLFHFWDYESRKSHIFGYLQDINDLMLRQEFLQKEAQRADRDPAVERTKQRDTA